MSSSDRPKSEKTREHLWRPYTNMATAAAPLQVAKTDGVRIHLEDGRELIDGIGSWWTAIHGYNHPEITAAMQRQLEDMPHVMLGGLVHEQAEKLARRLADLAPGDLDHVFFADSGSVAVEIAMKMAIAYWRAKGEPGRTAFLGFRNGYFGDTLATMAAGDVDAMHGAFRDAQGQHVIADLPETGSALTALEKTVAAHRDRLAAVMIEPLIQGAGGMKFHDEETLRRIADVTRDNGLILIADEIFTGMGRTGAMFASERAGIAPDLMCLSKALTGGAVAQSAVLASGAVFDALNPADGGPGFAHGPTYMANALACAAANAGLDLFETEDRLTQVKAIEAQMERELKVLDNLPGVADVRVMGAVAAVELDEARDMDRLCARFIEQGVWLRPIGPVVYLTPPYVIGAEDLSRLTGATVEAVREWAEG